MWIGRVAGLAVERTPHLPKRGRGVCRQQQRATQVLHRRAQGFPEGCRSINQGDDNGGNASNWAR
jgi:hypothetical protein